MDTNLLHMRHAPLHALISSDMQAIDLCCGVCARIDAAHFHHSPCISCEEVDIDGCGGAVKFGIAYVCEVDTEWRCPTQGGSCVALSTTSGRFGPKLHKAIVDAMVV